MSSKNLRKIQNLIRGAELITETKLASPWLIPEAGMEKQALLKVAAPKWLEMLRSGTLSFSSKNKLNRLTSQKGLRNYHRRQISKEAPATFSGHTSEYSKKFPRPKDTPEELFSRRTINREINKPMDELADLGTSRNRMGDLMVQARSGNPIAELRLNRIRKGDLSLKTQAKPNEFFKQSTINPWLIPGVGAGVGGLAGGIYAARKNRPLSSGQTPGEEDTEANLNRLLKRKELAGENFSYSDKLRLAKARLEHDLALAGKEHRAKDIALNALLGAGVGAALLGSGNLTLKKITK